MFFNPLFLQVTNSGQSTAQLNVLKMNGSSYLFSDIIKVCIDKTETLPEGILPKAVESEQELSVTDFFDSIFQNKIKLNELQTEPEGLENSNIEKIINNSSVKLTKTEVHQIITDLLKVGKDFNGKVSLLLDESHINENETFFEKIKESPENLIALLKKGGTLLIEDPEQTKDNGLLITIVEKEVNNVINKEKSSVPDQVNKNKIDTSAEYEFKLSQVNISDILNTSEIVKNIYSGTKINIVLNNSAQDYHSSTEPYKSEIHLFADSLEHIYKKVHFPYKVSFSTDKVILTNDNTPELKITDDKLSTGDKQVTLSPIDKQSLWSLDDQKSKDLEPKLISISTDKVKSQSILNSYAKSIEINNQIKPEISKGTEVNVSEKETQKNIFHLNTKLAETIITNKAEDKNIGSFENSFAQDKYEPVNFNMKVAQEELADSEFKRNIEPFKKADTQEADYYNILTKESKFQKIIPADEAKVADNKKDIGKNDKVELNNPNGQEKSSDRKLQSEKSKPDKMTLQKEEVLKSVKSNDPVLPRSFKEVISKGIKELNPEKPETEANIKTQGVDLKAAEQNSDLFNKNTKEGTHSKQNSATFQNPLVSENIDHIPEQKRVNTKQSTISSEKIIPVDNQSVEGDNDKSVNEKPASSDLENLTSKKNNTDPIFRTEPQVLLKEKPLFEVFHEQNPSKVIKVTEIVKEFSKFIQDGTKNSIVMKLDPENLGSVKIQLDVVNKIIHAHIEVENEATQKLVENNLSQLYNSLNQNDVQINSLNISLSNFAQKNTKNLFTRKRNQDTDHKEITEDKSIIQEKNLGYNTYDYLI